MVQIFIDYKGSLRCEAKHEPSAAILETDAPRDNQGLGASFSPTDLVATAAGTCIATTMGIVANREGIKIEGTRLSVQKVMTSQPPRKIAQLVVEIWLPISADHPGRPLLERAALNCPVFLSLHPEVEKPTTFHYTES